MPKNQNRLSNGFPNRRELKPSVFKKTKEQIGKKLTIEDEVVPIADMLKTYIHGFPLPLAKPGMEFPGLDELTEDSFDFPDVEKFARLDPVDQQEVKNNLNAMSTHFQREVEKRKAEYDDKTKTAEPEPEPEPEPAPAEIQPTE